MHTGEGGVDRDAGDGGDAVGAPEAERALVARAAAGDQDAFRQLYLLHAQVVAGFVQRRVRDHHLAEDMTAETFCRAYEKLPQYQDRGAPFRAWLLRIALNLVISRQRSKASTELVIDAVPEVTSSGHEDEVLRSIDAAEVREALASLNDKSRTVLLLRYFDELSVKETAEVLGMTDEAVRASTYRAMGALRTAYVRSGGTR